MVTLSQKRDAERRKVEELTPSDDDPHPRVHGVLLSDEITYYALHHHLLSPFDPENLKPAGYELTLGDEYFLSGEFLTLDSQVYKKSQITIPPFEVAVLKTAEMLCLPRYIIARWNIRVKHAYSGLLWVGGPQVDPGYVGHLFCPIYNLSDKPVTLHLGEPIALMDFVKTTPFDKDDGELVKYRLPPKRVILEDYGIDELRSALFHKAGTKLVEFEEQIRGLEGRFITFTQISFAIFASVIALFALFSKANIQEVSLSAAFWGSATISVSCAAVLIAMFSYMRGRVGRLVYEQYGRLLGVRAEAAQRFLRRKWWLGFIMIVVAAFVGAYGLYRLIAPPFENLRQQHVLVKSDLNAFEAGISDEVSDVRRRIGNVERGGTVTAADMEALRSLLEQEIGKLRAALDQVTREISRPNKSNP